MQKENYKPNREYIIPDNITITKAEFFNVCGSSRTIGSIDLYDQNGKKFVKIGQEYAENNISKTLDLKKNQFWVGMIADKTTTMFYHPIVMEINE